MLNLLARFDRRRFTPHVYAFRRGPLLGALRSLGVPVFAGRRTVAARWSAADKRAKVAFRLELARRLRRDRIDVCLVYSWMDAIAAAREAGVPAIVERVDGPKLIGWVRDKSSCQRVICESRAIARLLAAQRELLRCSPARVTVIPNGIDRERFDPDRYDRASCRRSLGVGDEEFLVGTIARLVPVKNLGHVLEACRLVMDRLRHREPPRFVIVGPDHGEGAALRRQARQLGVADRVRFVGERSDSARVLRALDVFVLPSLQEGLPFALLEAMSMGLPVIASQADSIAEVVRDNGYLVSPVDPLRTANALHDLMSEPALCRALGQRSRHLARRYDVEPMVRRYEQVLEDAFVESRRHSRTRRRIAVVPGHAGGGNGGTDDPLLELFALLRKREADAYWLGVRPGASEPVRSWPSPREQFFPVTPNGYRAREIRVQWLQPDLIVTDCPGVARWARSRFPGEEVVLVPEAGDRCVVDAATLGRIDRLVGTTPSARRWIRERWPRLSGRVSTPAALLDTPRPTTPRKAV